MAKVEHISCYNIETCGKWGELPQGYSELRHVIICDACGSNAGRLARGPEAYGLREKDKTTFSIRVSKEKP